MSVHWLAIFWVHFGHRVQPERGSFPGCLYFDGHCSSGMSQKLRMSINRGNTNWGSGVWSTNSVTVVTRIAGAAVPEGPAESMSVFNCFKGGLTIASSALEMVGVAVVSLVGEQMRDGPQTYQTAPPEYPKVFRCLHLKG